MFSEHKAILLLVGVTAMLSLSACNGIFGFLYDNPVVQVKTEYGFISADTNTHSGRIYIDATSYTDWQYIDLHNKEVVKAPVDSLEPARWDFAVHRYDAKTNGGAVWESGAADFNSLPGLDQLATAEFAADEWTTDRISVDVSQMMDGIIVYTDSYYNPCLSRWLDVNTSTMPPIYTLSGKIYILRLADGTYAALRLFNFMDDSSIKGFMTIDYLYPISF
jgi:hypothetical protein